MKFPRIYSEKEQKMNYEIVTDAAANLTYELVHKYDIKIMNMKYYVGEEEYYGYVDTEDDTQIKEFYAALRRKEAITTSCVNTVYCREFFEEILKQGKDLIYLAFSSGLSGTYNIALETFNQLREEYPERKLYIVDTLAASLGQGLLVDYAARQRRDGWTLEQVYEWQEQNKLHLAHWFTVDDLFFLKRGGRISGATAIAGTVLGIKPVLHTDDEGHLVNVTKVRGRKAALTELVNRMEATVIKPKQQHVFIVHGDCFEDMEFVKNLVMQRFDVKEKDITHNYVTPYIAAHSGPGTLALFFIGTGR